MSFPLTNSRGLYPYGYGSVAPVQYTQAPVQYAPVQAPVQVVQSVPAVQQVVQAPVQVVQAPIAPAPVRGESRIGKYIKKCHLKFVF